jgi:CheY-like chemotaxis protein
MIDPSDILKASILIVDDEEPNVLLLERSLRGAGLPPLHPRWTRARSVSFTAIIAMT